MDSLLPMDPRVVRAGLWGGLVYLHLLLLNRAHKCEGLIPVKYCAPDYLAWYLGVEGAPHLASSAGVIIRDGLKAAAREALIAIEPDGVRLVDRQHWESDSAPRVRALRQRRREERAKLSHQAVRPVDGTTQESDRANVAHLSMPHQEAATAHRGPGGLPDSGQGIGRAPARNGALLEGVGERTGTLEVCAVAGVHQPDGGPTGDERNVTCNGPIPPPPPPSPPPLFPSPYNPLPYTPSPLPPPPPVASDEVDPVDCNGVTLQGLGLDGGDLDLPFPPGWLRPDGTPSTPVDTPEPDPGPPVKPKKPARELPGEAYTLAELLRASIVRAHPNLRLARETDAQQARTIERWADPIDKLHRLDGCSWGEIREMITWATAHTFWGGVIQSAGNLRDHWDKMQGQRNARRPGPSAPAGGGRHEPTPGGYAEGEQDL